MLEQLASVLCGSVVTSLPDRQVRRFSWVSLREIVCLPLTRLVALDRALPVSGVTQGQISMLPDHKPAIVLPVGNC